MMQIIQMNNQMPDMSKIKNQSTQRGAENTAEAGNFKDRPEKIVQECRVQSFERITRLSKSHLPHHHRPVYMKR
jgi:hypothetical protein